jgi:hypothetical protein
MHLRPAPQLNSIGAHAGSYSIYRALSIAMGQLRPDWRPDLTNTHVGVASLYRNTAGS